MFFPKHKSTPFLKTKIGFSIHAAASLIYLLKKQRDAVGLTTFSDSITFHSQQKSTTPHTALLFHQLESIKETQKKGSTTDTVSCLHEIAERMHKRSLIIIFSDMLDNTHQQEDVFEALRHLKYNKHEVVLFHVNDAPKEMKLDYPNRPHKFIDQESKEEIKLNPKEIQEAYTELITRQTKLLKLKCAQYKIDYFPIDINGELSDVLSHFLIKRKRLY